MATTRRRTPAPDELDVEQLERLAVWVARKHPRQHAKLAYLVESMLIYHRAKGTLMADWYAAAQTWIRNEAEGRFSGARGPTEPLRPIIPVQPGLDYTNPAVAEMARRRERHRLEKLGRA